MGTALARLMIIFSCQVTLFSISGLHVGTYEHGTLILLEITLSYGFGDKLDMWNELENYQWSYLGDH